MPTHRVPRASLHEDLLDIERRQGEKVDSIIVDPADSAFYLIETRYDHTAETRPA